MCDGAPLTFLFRDSTAVVYPEGMELCRGRTGSMELKALSVNGDGDPFFNVPAITGDLRAMFPELSALRRLEGCQQMNVRDPLSVLKHTLSFLL